MCLPLVAGSDCTELEAMAIPTSDTSSHNMKKEALLSNLHHRFKKDQIYVSIKNSRVCNAKCDTYVKVSTRN
jgi:hypothetical protein